MADLLGAVHFEVSGTGRIRCLETGHEMPATDKDWYGRSKKCRRALFDLFLAQRKSPLHLFEQSPIYKDKVTCKITGDTLNKTEEALWKHMNGKKFQRKLAQKEGEKMLSGDNNNAVLTAVSMQLDDKQELKQELKDEGRLESTSSPTQKDDSENPSMNDEGFAPEDDMEIEATPDHDCEHKLSQHVTSERIQSRRSGFEGAENTQTTQRTAKGCNKVGRQKKRRKMEEPLVGCFDSHPVKTDERV